MGSVGDMWEWGRGGEGLHRREVQRSSTGEEVGGEVRTSAGMFHQLPQCPPCLIPLCTTAQPVCLLMEGTFQVQIHALTSTLPAQGYPGQLYVTVRYQLAKNANELTTIITATTDEATPGALLWGGVMAEGGV